MKGKKVQKNQKIRERGITLIALIITIIVLLILAGVTINALFGDSGIIMNAELAREMQEIANIKEEAELIKAELQIDNYTGNKEELNKDNIITALKDNFKGSKIEEGKVVTSDGKYHIVVKDNLEIEVIKSESSNGNENQEKLEISYTIENIGDNAKAIKLSYSEEVASLSADKIEVAIKNLLGITITEEIRGQKQTLAKECGLTYEEILLEFIIENATSTTITENARKLLKEEAKALGIEYQEYLLEKILNYFNGSNITNEEREILKMFARTANMSYLQYLGVNIKDGKNIDILKTISTEIKMNQVLVTEQVEEFIATKNGIYTVTAETEDGKTGKIEIEITGINEEKFSKIYSETKYYVDVNGKIAKIPEGFAVGTSNKINTVANGLVITDAVDSEGYSIGNEFVWIPVENEAYLERTDFDENGNVVNNLDKNSFLEPLDEETSEFDEMKKQVLQNKGFYIARYEAGDNTKTLGFRYRSNYKTNPMAVSKRGVVPYNNVDGGTSEAIDLAKNMYVESPSVVSTLVYGSQWDAMCKFIGDSNRKATIRNYLSLTGKVSSDFSKNIYDLAGNCQEWTMEAYQNEYTRIIRGGCALAIQNAEVSISHRMWILKNDGGFWSTFRCALYIK